MYVPNVFSGSAHLLMDTSVVPAPWALYIRRVLPRMLVCSYLFAALLSMPMGRLAGSQEQHR